MTDRSDLATRSGSRWHITALDGVRGVAVLLVMGFHFAIKLLPGGAMGVDIFFVLSGFLITSLLLNEWSKSGRVDLGGFYIRRAGRLLPALAVFLLVVAPFVAVIIKRASNIGMNSIYTLFYVADFAAGGAFPTPITDPYGHTWSLAVEEQFYLIWPIMMLIYLTYRRRGWPLGTAVWLLGMCASIFVSVFVGVGQNYFLPTGHIHALAAGCVAALAVKEFPANRVRPLCNMWAATGACAMIILLAVTHRQAWPTYLAEPADFLGAVAAAVVILHVGTGAKSWITKILSLPVLVWFGRRSYGIYLYHVAFYYLFREPYVHASALVNTVLAVAVSLAFAELSYRFVEMPVLERSRTWSKRRAAKRYLLTETTELPKLEPGVGGAQQV